MIAYLDSSIVLRILLGQPNRLKEWEDIDEGVASALVELECLRTVDRLRLRLLVTDEAVTAQREAVFALLREARIVEPTGNVLARASQPLPTPLGMLDAIHLATALLWRECRESDLVFATHDAALALAARACGLSVVGV